MSVTVTAVPIVFLSTKVIAAAMAITTTAVTATAATVSLKSAIKNSEIDDILNTPVQFENKLVKLTKEDIDLLSKEYETPFMNKELLERTLSEYGFKIEKSSELSVIATIERLFFTFARSDVNSPFLLKIEFPDDCMEMQAEVAASLYEEYGGNTQEETYIRIKEKIDESNMYIEDEEILEDDSIVLTINLE
ncbi:MAG: hypothetical protein ACI37T_04445 [Candidatus Gastranaerophilaceae bacterium]